MIDLPKLRALLKKMLIKVEDHGPGNNILIMSVYALLLIVGGVMTFALKIVPAVGLVISGIAIGGMIGQLARGMRISRVKGQHKEKQAVKNQIESLFMGINLSAEIFEYDDSFLTRVTEVKRLINEYYEYQSQLKSLEDKVRTLETMMSMSIGRYISKQNMTVPDKVKDLKEKFDLAQDKCMFNRNYDIEIESIKNDLEDIETRALLIKSFYENVGRGDYELGKEYTTRYINQLDEKKRYSWH